MGLGVEGGPRPGKAEGGRLGGGGERGGGGRPAMYREIRRGGAAEERGLAMPFVIGLRSAAQRESTEREMARHIPVRERIGHVTMKIFARFARLNARRVRGAFS